MRIEFVCVEQFEIVQSMAHADVVAVLLIDVNLWIDLLLLK